ncbi:MAG: F0F1 ATP synthase subunit B, partial [Prochlorococcaceae cyanobacterium]
MSVFIVSPILFANQGGFGLKLNLFETNLINLVIVIGVLVWFLKG